MRHPDVVGLLLCVVSLTMSVTLAEKVCSSADHSGHGLCGQKLANMLSDLCHYSYNSLQGLMKRFHPSHPGMQGHHLRAEDMPFLGKSHAMSYLHGPHDAALDHQRRKRGIVCECCVHKCSLGELNEYCAYPSANGQRKRSGSRHGSALFMLPLSDNQSQASTERHYDTAAEALAYNNPDWKTSDTEVDNRNEVEQKQMLDETLPGRKAEIMSELSDRLFDKLQPSVKASLLREAILSREVNSVLQGDETKASYSH